MSEIWAKSGTRDGGTPVRLADHTRDVLDAFNELKERVKDPQLCELIRIAIVCHDWGKVLPVFQIRTLKHNDYEPFYPYHNVPHSLFSILWINCGKLRERIPKRLDTDVNDYVNFIISAVAYHHWREEFIELLSSHNRELGELCEELKNRGYIDNLQSNLQEEIKQLGDTWHLLVKFNDEMAEGLKNGVPFSEYACPPYQLYWLPKRTDIDDRKLKDWIFISGFLIRSDHFASFCEEEGEKYPVENQNISPEMIRENIKAKIQEKGGNIDETKIWQFEKIGNLKDKNIVLVAPTGYGKTEFAFLWSNGEKFFYTLPLRAAVNQMFERAKRIFREPAQTGGQSSSEQVGLLHSDADVYLLGDGGEAQANLKAYDLARQLACPALISTGDQFFPYALRPPGYEKIYATFSYSRLVIDEVQAYDPRAAAIIVKFMEDIVRMGGKFLLMTATLPGFVKKQIDHVIGQGGYELINLYEEEKNQFKELKKHKIKVELIENAPEDGKPDFIVPQEKLKDVLKQAIDGKRVLVIANTVKQAQEIFERLKRLIDEDAQYEALKEKIWLLHSRFTQADRSDLEMKICGDKDRSMVGEFQNPKPDSEKEGKILVATQVVEASLDIDADVLFTEIAPVDALVQRMGRIWRRYGPLMEPGEIPSSNDPNIYIWVFRDGLQSGQYYVYDNDLILLTLKLLKDRSSDKLEASYKDWLSEKVRKQSKAQDRIKSVIEEVFGPQESQEKKVTQKRRRKQKTDLPTPLVTSLEFQLISSESDKFELVEKLYDLPEDHNYLEEFHNTKAILDAGYMSDRLKEAHEIFRRIYTVSIIPSKKNDEFMQNVKSFFINTQKDDKRLFTRFKKEVLSKFIVQVPLCAKQLQERKLQPAEIWIKDLSDISDEQKEQLIRWCRDIYFADYQYTSHIGIVVDAPYHNIEACIL